MFSISFYTRTYIHKYIRTYIHTYAHTYIYVNYKRTYVNKKNITLQVTFKTKKRTNLRNVS